MKDNKIYIILCFVSVIISFITHFGYISGYTKDVASNTTMRSQYDSGIYKYRILSKYMIVFVDNVLQKTPLNKMENNLSRITKFIDKDGQLSFYFSYFAINSIFLVLFATTFFKLMVLFETNPNKKYILAVTIVTCIALSLFQYVLVFYDYSSYFFNILIIYLFHKYLISNSKTILALMSLTVIIATFNRETAALSISYMIAFLFDSTEKRMSHSKFLVFPILSYLISYLVLRILFGFEDGLMNKVTLTLNLVSPLNLFGIFVFIFSVYMFYLFSNNRKATQKLNYLLIFSIPYLLVSFMSGITFEIRLWVPVLINMFILLLFFNLKGLKE